MTTGGAPPSPTLLARLGALNFDVTHVYGLTETYGPAAICDWLPEWDSLDADVKAVLKARQGVNNVVSEPIRVWADGHEVPHDGEDTPRPAWRAACDVGQQPRLNSRPLVVPATDCRAR